MTRPPRVSIVTPTYNHAAFIGACLESVLGQTVPDWELIVVDDGSTDGTGDIVRAYRDRDPRVRYLHQANVGPFRLDETYNRALAEATGAYVAILEGDDLWPPDKLERQLAILADRPDLVMLYGRAQLVDADGVPRGHNRLPSVPADGWDAISTRDLLLRRASILPVTSLARRDALAAIGGFRSFPGFPAVDYPTWLALAAVGPFGFRDQVFGCWRLHGSQITAREPLNVPARALALAHFDGLDPQARDALGLRRREIEAVHGRFIADTYWSYALRSADAHEWRACRSHLAKVLRTGGPFRRAEAVAALPLTYARINPAAVVRLAARASARVGLAPDVRPAPSDQPGPADS